GPRPGAATAGADRGRADDAGARAGGAERTKGRPAGDKYRIGGGRRPPVLQIGDDRLPPPLAQRQVRRTATFPGPPNPGVPPVDVTQAQLHDIPRPQPEAGQQEENRAIAPTDGRCVIARGDHALDLRRLEVPRQGTEPPVGDGGDRGVEAHGTVAAGNQAAQEQAKSRRATLGGGPAGAASLLQDERAELVDVPAARRLT